MYRDKNYCDLLIVIGSSLKVRPVALIPSSLPPEVPQILINRFEMDKSFRRINDELKHFREPLPHCTFDVELLGDCDSIINQICLMLGEGWDSPVHRDKLEQIVGLPVEYYKNREKTDVDPSNEEKEEKKEKSDEVDISSCTEKADEKEASDLGEPSKAANLNLCDKPQEDKEMTEEKDPTVDSDVEDEYSRSIAEFIQDGQFLFLPPAR